MKEQDTSRATSTSKEDVAADQIKRDSPIESSEKEEPKHHYSWRFWVIFPALCITGFLYSFEASLVSNLVPVRERGSFMGITFAAVNFGTALGPFIGGIIVDTISWRWAFYINLPIAGFVTLVVFFALDTGYRKDLVKERIFQIDLVGNAI